MNYSKEDTEWMLSEYEKSPTRETVEKIAAGLEKSIKSVIGKLSREGVYRREVYKTKTGENPVTKLEIVSSIADKLAVESEKLSGLEKSPKPVLKLIENLLDGL